MLQSTNHWIRFTLSKSLERFQKTTAESRELSKHSKIEFKRFERANSVLHFRINSNCSQANKFVSPKIILECAVFFLKTFWNTTQHRNWPKLLNYNSIFNFGYWFYFRHFKFIWKITSSKRWLILQVNNGAIKNSGSLSSLTGMSTHPQTCLLHTPIVILVVSFTVMGVTVLSSQITSQKDN